MAVTEECKTIDLFSCGHRGCAGCGEGTAVRMIINTAGPNSIVSICTGCLEVMTTPYPETAWEVPIIHAAFENNSAVASGVDAALKALGKREGINVLAFGGDGGTFDIGLQALSGMLERGHNIKYFCFDNEAYMNTGIQRCSSTPYGASTTTSPAGKFSIGEQHKKKPIGAIVAAHDIPYTATATIAYPKDLRRKVERALEIEGPTFLHIFTPCPTGWRYPSELTVQIARLAVQTGVFILWELEGGDFRKININKKLPNRKPVIDYLKLQGRFRHLMKDEKALAEIQKMVDEKCEQYGI